MMMRRRSAARPALVRGQGGLAGCGESSVITLAQATERNPPPLILPVKPPHARARMYSTEARRLSVSEHLQSQLTLHGV